MDAELIQSDPAVMMGKPVVAGTRITVESILEKLAAGETVDQILEAHPRLTPEGVPTALSFSAWVLSAMDWASQNQREIMDKWDSEQNDRPLRKIRSLQ